MLLSDALLDLAAGLLKALLLLCARRLRNAPPASASSRRTRLPHARLGDAPRCAQALNVGVRKAAARLEPLLQRLPARAASVREQRRLARARAKQPRARRG